jgi:hypothetical protein
MSSRRGPWVILALLVVGAVAAGLIYVGNARNISAAEAKGRNEIASNGNVQGRLYTGNPATEASLVEREDERLVYVRTIASAARWRVEGLEGPYRLRTGSAYTLILPARKAAYTTKDLLALAPKSFRAQPGGHYLLSESVVVLAGATLFLNSPAPDQELKLRMESGPESFVSVVTLGGSLAIGGAKASTATVTSWDSATGAPDIVTADGRAYIRVIGGHASISHSHVSNLGFWSGNTGGLSLTGTDAVSTFSEKPPTPAETAAASAGARLLPDKELTTLFKQSGQDYSLVTAGIENLRVDKNAFGLFVTNARDIAIRDTAITRSLVDGLVLHRYVTDASITRTTSSDNAVDGFSVGRSTTRVSLDAVDARGNGRNGMTFDGRPLADGPNAVGTPVDAYGSNRVTGSRAERNARYGVELSGGSNLTVADSFIVKNDVGVVVNNGATGVTIAGNEFRDQVRQAVAVRDAEARANVTRNTIAGGDTGIYVRDAHADITGNTLTDISNHAVTLLGDVKDTAVEGNAIAGYGSTAIWKEQSSAAELGENDLLGWAPAYTVERVVDSVFQPLTFIWFMLGALLLVTAAAKGRRSRRHVFRSPYADHVPLTSLTRGIISLEDIRPPH